MGSESSSVFTPGFVMTGIILCWILGPSHGSGGLSHGGVLLLGHKPSVDVFVGSVMDEDDVGNVDTFDFVVSRL